MWSLQPQLSPELTALIKINGHWLAHLMFLSQTISAESSAQWSNELGGLTFCVPRGYRYPAYEDTMAFQFINDEQSQDRCEESLSGDVRQQVLMLMCCDVRDIARICARARLAGTAPRRPRWTRAAASVHHEAGLLCVSVCGRGEW